MRDARPQISYTLLVLCWGALALNYVDRQMAYSVFPALKSDLGFTDGQLGLVGTVFSLVYTICMPIAGRFSDIFRRDRMVVASVALWSAATLGCSLSGSVPAFLVWRAVMGITESLYYPAAMAMLAATYSSSLRSKALGIHQSAQFAGLVIGGWYGGWMADQFSWRTGFAVAAVVGVLYAAILQARLPRTEAAPAADSGRTATRLAELSGSRCYVAICTAFFWFCAMLWVFYAWYPSFLYERYHLSMTESGFNATIFTQLSCGAGVIAGGFLGDRLSRRIPAARFYVAAGGMLLCAPFGYLTFAAPTLDLARLFSALYGAFAGILIANIFAAAYDVVSASNYGFGVGVLNTVGGISASIMIYFAGVWKNSLGFAGLLKWVGVICVAAALLLIVTAALRFRVERTQLSAA